ncbi:hypothetical protein HDV06_002713 [Boothiomyces sp. JEL0866]|nr:hypothetical protein HDV06_002713 [Boothiomyces sp. JEL0866]
MDIQLNLKFQSPRMALNKNEIEMGKFLPLLDMSSKSLMVQGNEGYLPGPLKARQLYNQMGIPCHAINNSKRHRFAKPTHIIHKAWCSFSKNSKCICQLYNPHPPQELLVRVECTKGKINGFVEYAQIANENGAYNLTNSILHCFEAQRNMEIEERANTMVYPVLNTKWNHKVGEDTLLKVEVPEIKFKRITTPKKHKPQLKRKTPNQELSLAAMAEFYPKEMVTEDINLLEQAKQIEQQRKEKRERIAEKIRQQKEKARLIKIRLEKRKVYLSNRAIAQARIEQEEEQKKLLEAQEKKLRRLELQKERKSSQSLYGLSRKKKSSKRSVNSDSSSQLDINNSYETEPIQEHETIPEQTEGQAEIQMTDNQLENQANNQQEPQMPSGESPTDQTPAESMIAPATSDVPEPERHINDDPQAVPSDTKADEISKSNLPDLPSKGDEGLPNSQLDPEVSRIATAESKQSVPQTPITDLSSTPESILKFDSNKHTPDGQVKSSLEEEKKQILDAVGNMTPRHSVIAPATANTTSKLIETDLYHRRNSFDSIHRPSINEEAILRANYRDYDESRPQTVDTNTPFTSRKSKRPNSGKLSKASSGEISRKNSLRDVVDQARRSIGSDNGVYMDADGVLILADQVKLEMEQIRYENDIEAQIANLRDIVKAKKEKIKALEIPKAERKKKSVLPKIVYDKEYVIEKDSNVDRNEIKFGIQVYKKKTLQPFVTTIPIKRSKQEYIPPNMDAVHKYIGRPAFASQNQFLYDDIALKIDFDALNEDSEEEDEFDTPYVPPEDALEIEQEDSYLSVDNFYEYNN